MQRNKQKQPCFSTDILVVFQDAVLTLFINKILLLLLCPHIK